MNRDMRPIDCNLTVPGTVRLAEQVRCIEDKSHGAVLLRAQNLMKAFGGQIILDGLSLELKNGDFVLLSGENGSGKTSLLNILTGYLEPDAGIISYLTDGQSLTYYFPRRWWSTLNPLNHFVPEIVVRRGVGRTWQEVRLFGSESLIDNIAVAVPRQRGENPFFAVFSRRAIRKEESDIRADAEALLASLGLAGRELSSADKISFGQSKRVAIARAVAAGARILFLDEPLAGLDKKGAGELIALIESLSHNLKIIFVIVEHVFNQPQLRHLVKTDWTLSNGKLIVSNSGTSKSSAHEHKTLDRSTVASNQSRAVSLNRPTWFSLLAANEAQVTEEAMPRGATLIRVRTHDKVDISRRPVLELRNVSVRLGPRTVIGSDGGDSAGGFSLSLYDGELLILQAPNGWGKSTLLAFVLGLLPGIGEVILSGERLQNLKTWERVKRGLRAFPSGERGFPSLRVRDCMRLAGNHSATGNAEILPSRRLSSLSGGERQWVAWQCLWALRDRCQAVLLDEPFGGLDESHLRQIVKDLCHAPWRAALILVPQTAES